MEGVCTHENTPYPTRYDIKKKRGIIPTWHNLVGRENQVTRSATRSCWSLEGEEELSHEKIFEEILVPDTIFHQCTMTVHNWMECYNITIELDDDDLLAR